MGARVWMVLLIAGCYAPDPPSGAYRCSSSDNACPKGQHCVCDLCVDKDQDAACSFAVEASANAGVQEHQSFPVTIRALQKDGSAAAGFANTVTLSFVLPDGAPWCDVTPSTVKLDKGTQTVMVTLNRETIPPQRPKLRAVFAGNRGDSAGIVVTAPPFIRDLTPIVPVVTPNRPFGWSDLFATQPALLHDANGFRMYFVGFSATSKRISIGVATSSDGKMFTPLPDPVWKPMAGTWYGAAVQGPAPFFSKGGTSLAFTGTEDALDLTPTGQIGIATSGDGLTPFTIGNGGNPVLRHKAMGQMADCDYCSSSIDFAHVIDEPIGENSLGGKLMFFSAYNESKIPAIGRASSSDDGKTWVPEPAPVLSGDLGGEGILMAPHVLVDGSVFKMWYTFASLGDVLNSGTLMCETPLHIGYATSSDGFYWVRSPTNVRNPAVTRTNTGWDAGVTGFIAGTAIPTDGSDPKNGIALYYTTLRHLVEGDPTSGCIANGIGRSTRL
jgi:hypothetical protein